MYYQFFTKIQFQKIFSLIYILKTKAKLVKKNNKYIFLKVFNEKVIIKSNIYFMGFPKTINISTIS